MNVTKLTLPLALTGALLFCIGTVSDAAPNLVSSPKFAQTAKFSGPYTYKNLSVFLIHGKDTAKGQVPLTLQEALASKQIVINETGNVNTLNVQNNGKIAVFIQSGDIIKGGRQDRALQSDMLVPPNSKVIPISVFCVEHGRWSQRGNEAGDRFTSSENGLASKELKIAAKVSANQSEVWDKVSDWQSKASAGPAAGRSVAAMASPTSLELSLESKEVQDRTKEYVSKLQGAIDGKDDVIGYSFAVNGKVNSTDVYGSNALFKKLWPKLIKTTAAEALSDVQPGKTNTVKESDVRKMIAEIDDAPVSPKPMVQSVASRVHYARNGGGYKFSTSVAAPALQGATAGTIGPQGSDATYVSGIHTNYLSK